jgi:GNAT superfamily N-acetyltransferase
LPDAYLDRVMPVESRTHWQNKMEELAAGAGLTLIAESGGEPVGFVCMFAPDEDDSVFIDNLHALPDRKGSGTGTALLAAAAGWARRRAARRMHLLVLEANIAAIGFYESRGWRCIGRKEDDTMGGIDIVALIYALPLD